MNKVMVFGSFVVDLMSRTPHLPAPGETVKGSVFKMGPGGKGFNQGVAAHKAGVEVSMVTKLGRDAFGKVATDTMKDLGMNQDHVLFTDQTETGCALILVDENTSQNEIVVVLGACETITDEEVEALKDALKGASYLLTQLETNVSSVYKIVELANSMQVPVILNPAPIQTISDYLLRDLYLITPNEVEAEALTGIKIEDEEQANKAADYFFARGVKNVIITLGGRGIYLATSEKRGIIPAYRVDAVDTTGAGDAFNGGLVAALAEGKSLEEAVEFANALAAIAVQRIGTTPAMPTREEIDAFLKSRREEG
jgi:ribokinase